MSDFLSNMLNRHTNTENIVRPRGKSIFETHRPHLDPFSSPADGEYVDSTPSKDKVAPRHDQIIRSQSLEESTILKNDRSIDKEAKKKKENTTGHFVGKKDYKTDPLPTKNAAIVKEDLHFKYMTTEESVMDKLENRLTVSKSNKKFPSSNSQRIDKQGDVVIVKDQMPVEPNKETNQRRFSEFNSDTQSENNIKINSTSENSKGNQTPTIKIHIGRIDIKAVHQSTTKKQKDQKVNKSGRSLDQFLKKRAGKR